MAYRVDLTARANRDLQRIFWHVCAQVSVQAAAWFNGLEAAVHSLEKHPDRGAITSENKKLRHLLYGRKPHIYRIIYRVNKRAKRVEILHIRHGARDKFK